MTNSESFNEKLDFLAYRYVVLRINPEVIQEALKEAGLVAKWEAKGEYKKAREIAKNLLNKGFSVEETAKLTELNIKNIRDDLVEK
jgi:fumarate hydratase class II